MKSVRTCFALALAAVLTLPYVSPAVCAALDREMTMAHAGTSVAVAGDGMVDNCDTLDCATVAVAPMTTAAGAFAVRPLDGRDLPCAPLRPHDNDPSPLTHPPQA